MIKKTKGSAIILLALASLVCMFACGCSNTNLDQSVVLRGDAGVAAECNIEVPVASFDVPADFKETASESEYDGIVQFLGDTGSYSFMLIPTGSTSDVRDQFQSVQNAAERLAANSNSSSGVEVLKTDSGMDALIYQITGDSKTTVAYVQFSRDWRLEVRGNGDWSITKAIIRTVEAV